MAGKTATDFDKRLGERIAAFRTAADMTQREVADALGVSAAQLQKYEKGVNCLKANTIPILADLFGRRLADFFDPDPHGAASESPTGESPMTVADAADMLAETVVRMGHAAGVVKSALAQAARPPKGVEEARPAPSAKARPKPPARGAGTGGRRRAACR